MTRLWGVFLLWAATLSGASAQENVPEVARQKLEEADRHRESGRTDEAIERYREVIDLAPSLLDAYVGLGALYHQSNDYQNAIGVFSTGLERFPEDATLLFNAAATEMRLERFENALGYTDRCLKVNRDDPAVHALRGTLSRRLGQYEDALRSFQQVVDLDAKNARAHYNVGNVYHQLDRKTDALEAYRTAVEIDENFRPAHYNLGAVLFELERFDEALRAYEVALEPVEKDFAQGKPVAPAHARAYANLGAIYLRRQSWDRALDAYGKAVRLDPSSAAAHYNLGYIHYQLGAAGDAYDAYRQAVDLDADLPLSYLHMGLIDFQQGRMERSARWLETGLSKFEGEDRKRATLVLARAYQALGDEDRAEATYRDALRDEPANVTALVNLGRMLRLKGELDEARTLLEAASGNVLESSGIAIELAALARASGDLERERALYEEALRRDGHRPEMWPVRMNLVAVLTRTGAVEDALAEMERLVPQLDTIGASAPEAATHLRTSYALLKARGGDVETARAELRAVLAASPGFVPAANGLAAIDAASGDLARANASWERLVNAGTDESRLDVLARANLGQSLWLSGRRDEARTYLLESSRKFPGSVAIRTALGEIELAARDYAASVRELDAAVKGCAQPGTSSSVSSLIEVELGGARTALCARAEKSLGVALVASAGVQMIASPRDAERALDTALRYSLEPAIEAQALFMRGTIALRASSNSRARADLERALAGALPDTLVAAAHNNLGVALYRSGESARAVAHFGQARQRMSQLAPATLNLAIASHDRKDAERALALYEEYLSIGGGRSEDAKRWADSIRRIYR